MPSSRSGAGATLWGEKGAGAGGYRLRDDPKGSAKPEIKSMTLLDLEFANDVMTAEARRSKGAHRSGWRADSGSVLEGAAVASSECCSNMKKFAG